jgi:hypothetical protein
LIDFKIALAEADYSRNYLGELFKTQNYKNKLNESPPSLPGGIKFQKLKNFNCVTSSFDLSLVVRRWEKQYGSFVISLPSKDKVYGDLQRTRQHQPRTFHKQAVIGS